MMCQYEYFKSRQLLFLSICFTINNVKNIIQYTSYLLYHIIYPTVCPWGGGHCRRNQSRGDSQIPTTYTLIPIL